MKSPSWLDAHLRAFTHFGGVTQIVVPDNPTTSTHQRHKGESQRVVNARYQQLADHHRCGRGAGSLTAPVPSDRRP
jgi:transposase